MNPATMDGPEAAATVAVLDEANAALRGTYQLVRPLQGGFQSGAWLIQDHAGRQAVLKWTPNRTWAEQIQRASRAVADVRRRGYPDTGMARGRGDWFRIRLSGPGVRTWSTARP